MENRSITFGYLRERDIKFTGNERFLEIDIICNDGDSKTYHINCENVREYRELICNMIYNKNRDHPGMDYLTCTIKWRDNVTECIKFENDDRTFCTCGLDDIGPISKAECSRFINSMLYY